MSIRIFQNSGIYPSYKPRLNAITKNSGTFADAISAFLEDRFGAAHFLKPILDGEPNAFFANGDYRPSQELWAIEKGLRPDISLDEILLAQIEEHRSEVFYNLDPIRFGDSFLKRLPGSVKRTVAWRAAPSNGSHFLKYDYIVNNFPSLLDGYRKQGARVAYLFPAHDPFMDNLSANVDRPIDVLFIGSYSRHHRTRAAMLDAIAKMHNRLSIVMHLDTSKYTRLAESPLGWFGPLKKDRRSREIRKVARGPVFGRQLLEVISQSKIVVNGAIDMAGSDRGNMRIWEALGCGATLISDSGNYPPHIEAGVHFHEYSDPIMVPSIIDDLINSENLMSQLAIEGRNTIRDNYSKTAQYDRFLQIIS